MSVINLTNQENPDKVAISNKSIISISITQADISASLTGSPALLNDVQLNNTQQRLVVVSAAPSATDLIEATGGKGIYYVPVYAERISYDQWKLQINKNFQELEVG
jgi:hypothetical protein